MWPPQNIELAVNRAKAYCACSMCGFEMFLFFSLSFVRSPRCLPLSGERLDIDWPEVIKLFSCSTQLSMEFILLINVKMPTIVGILTVMN